MTAYVVKRPTGVGVLSRGKDYSVKDLGGSQAGYTNLLKKELGVSLLAEAPQTRWTQIHELSHVRHSLWSPARIAKYILKTTRRRVDVTCVLAAEDARINEIAHRRVPDAHKGFRLADETGAGLRQDIEGYVASHASPQALADAIRPACDVRAVEAVDAWLARLPRMAERELSVLRVTVPLAMLLDDLQRGRMEEEDGETGEACKGRGKRGKGEASAESEREEEEDEDEDDGADEDEDDEDESDAGDGEAGEEDEPGDGSADDAAGDEDDDGAADTGDDDDAGDVGTEEDAEALGEPDAHEGACGSPMAKGGAEDGGGGRDGRPARWIIPTVEEPALTVPLRGGNAMVTTAETGSALRWASLHRIATDGVVFRKVRRRPGALQRGTVLIDVSGSMSFENADLDAIIAAMPYATVAVYAGQPGGRAWVTVVARNGRRVASLGALKVTRAGGNTCDGPALLWLSRQATPRLWVCDGVVTRDDDRADADLAKQCAAIMESAGILQVVRVGAEVRVTRRMVDGRAPRVAELLQAVRDLERGRVRP